MKNHQQYHIVTLLADKLTVSVGRSVWLYRVKSRIVYAPLRGLLNLFKPTLPNPPSPRINANSEFEKVARALARLWLQSKAIRLYGDCHNIKRSLRQINAPNAQDTDQCFLTAFTGAFNNDDRSSTRNFQGYFAM